MDEKITANTIKPSGRIVRINGRRMMLYSILLIAVIASLYYLLYAWYRSRIIDSEAKTISLTNQVETQKETISKLQSALKPSQQTEDRSSANASKEPDEVDYSDGNFVAMSPVSGFLASKEPMTFSWTPHKDATYYVFEYKVRGQASYPAKSPESQYLRFSSTQKQPSVLKMTIDFKPQGVAYYEWRISARAVIDGEEVVLQTTPSADIAISA